MEHGRNLKRGGRRRNILQENESSQDRKNGTAKAEVEKPTSWKVLAPLRILQFLTTTVMSKMTTKHNFCSMLCHLLQKISPIASWVMTLVRRSPQEL